MSKFQEKLSSCKKCKYYNNTFVSAESVKNPKIVIIGDYPLDQDVKACKILSGDRSDKLDELLSPNGLSRNKAYVTPAVKCRPNKTHDGKYEDIPKDVITQCSETFLIPEIKHYKPNVVVPLGDIALHSLTKKRGITKQRGFTFYHNIDKDTRIKVIPSFHPNYLMNSPQMMPFSMSDFNQIREQQDSRKILDLSKTVDYKSLKSLKQANKMFDELEQSDAISIDIEATGLNYLKDHTLGISFSSKIRKSRVLHFYKKFPKKLKWAWNKKLLKRIFNLLQSGVIIYGQNFKFDLRGLNQIFITELGLSLNIHKINFREVMMMQMLVDENIPKDLKSLAHMMTDIRYDKAELANVTKLATVSHKRFMLYAAKDTDATLRIGKMLEYRLKNEEGGILWKLFIEEEMPASKWAWDMERFGIHISPQRVKKLGRDIKKKLKIFKKQMYKIVGRKFNPRSTKELPIIMFEELKIKGNTAFKTKKTGKFSTGKDHIDWLLDNDPHPFLKILKSYRQYDKVHGTFVKGMRSAMDKHDIVHSDFIIWGTVGGRFSAKMPNVLNIPRDKEFADKDIVSVRRIFTARPGYVMVVADYSQIEYKMIALMANVKSLIKELAKGADFHALTARDMYGKKWKKAERILKEGKLVAVELEKWKTLLKEMRTKSKTFNFAMVYQAGDEKLAKQMEASIDKARAFKAKFFKMYPEIENMINQTGAAAIVDGRVQLPNGRIRRFPKVYNQAKQAHQKRQAFNIIPQGTAGYVCRAALIRICKQFKKKKIKGFPINIVYDSVMVEVKKKHVNKAQKIMAKEMLRPVKWLNNFVFSIELGVGNDWAITEKIAYPIRTMKDIQPWSYNDKKWTIKKAA